MRQIKFRVWDKKYKQYIVCGYPYGNDAVYSMNPYSGKFQILNASYDYDTGADIQAKEPDVILEQFTGLLDKDGNEIYEGDIVDFKYTHDVARSYNREYRAVVEYDTCNPCFVLKEITTNKFPHLEYDWVICGLVTLKVIGNIHEEQK